MLKKIRVHYLCSLVGFLKVPNLDLSRPYYVPDELNQKVYSSLKKRVAEKIVNLEINKNKFSKNVGHFEMVTEFTISFLTVYFDCKDLFTLGWLSFYVVFSTVGTLQPITQC